ncbi:hypothetical protein BC829DRAFT_235601 [Chytridium lagenaria]|nr:hypothetical protein BC829DRAFT_235601 [Chytridium lagenaria]
MKNSLFGSSTSIRIVLDDAKSVAKDGKAGEMDLIEIPSSKAENFKGRHEDLGISDFASPTPAQIKGRVILSLGKQLNHATELSIRLWGSISLDATGVMHWVSPDVHTVQAIKNIVVDNTVVLWRKSSSKTALNTASGSFEAGQYEYPFTIHLPGDTPPSINVSYGTIKYYVRARLARSGINPDVCSSTKPLAITRTRAPNMTLQEQEFETRFHRIKVHFPEEIPADAKYVKVSTEISVLDRDAIDCLAAVKLAFVERRAYSCGIPNKKLMYKEETVFGKGAKHAIKDPRNTFESNRSNGISEQQLHAELNFPLAASRLPAVLPPPLRFSMNVPVEGANVSFRTHDFRIAHRLLIRLDMDTTVWGGDRNFKLDIPACVVSVAQNHTPMYKKPSYAESTFSAMGGTSCSASIASGISYISSTNTSTDNIKIKDALGIAIPGDAVSRISSAENLKANIHGGHSLMNYRHIDKNMDERVEALVDSAQDKCEFSVGSFSVKAARSLINSPTSPRRTLGLVTSEGKVLRLPQDSVMQMMALRKTSRSRSTSGASSKLGGHVQLPLTPESMDEHESPPRVMMVTPPTPTLHPSKSMPFLKSKDGKQEEPIKEEETIEGRSRSASANELSQTQSYPFLAVDPVSTRSSPSKLIQRVPPSLRPSNP